MNTENFKQVVLLVPFMLQKFELSLMVIYLLSCMATMAWFPPLSYLELELSFISSLGGDI